MRQQFFTIKPILICKAAAISVIFSCGVEDPSVSSISSEPGDYAGANSAGCNYDNAAKNGGWGWNGSKSCLPRAKNNTFGKIDRDIGSGTMVGGHSCEDQAKWGKCSWAFMIGKCEKACQGKRGKGKVGVGKGAGSSSGNNIGTGIGNGIGDGIGTGTGIGTVSGKGIGNGIGTGSGKGIGNGIGTDNSTLANDSGITPRSIESVPGRCESMGVMTRKAMWYRNPTTVARDGCKVHGCAPGGAKKLNRFGAVTWTYTCRD